MAHYLRVIPNSLYNKLLAEGKLEGSEFFPGESKTNIKDSILALVNDSLRADARESLKDVDINRNKEGLIVLNNLACTETELAQAINSYLLESPNLTELTGWPILKLIVKKPSDQTSFSWVTFESTFKF